MFIVGFLKQIRHWGLNLSPNTATALSTGGDVNFWIKDAFVNTHDYEFATLTGSLSLKIKMDTPANTVSLKASYLSENFETIIYTSATHRWINIQLLFKESDKMEVFAWDYGDYTLEPKAHFEVASPGSFGDNNLVLKSTGVTQGVYFSEIRVYKMNTTLCTGFFYKNYDILSNIPSNMIQYARFSQGVFYLRSHLATPDSQNISADVASFDVNI